AGGTHRAGTHRAATAGGGRAVEQGDERIGRVAAGTLGEGERRRVGRGGGVVLRELHQRREPRRAEPRERRDGRGIRRLRARLEGGQQRLRRKGDREAASVELGLLVGDERLDRRGGAGIAEQRERLGGRDAHVHLFVGLHVARDGDDAA